MYHFTCTTLSLSTVQKKQPAIQKEKCGDREEVDVGTCSKAILKDGNNVKLHKKRNKNLKIVVLFEEMYITDVSVGCLYIFEVSLQ